MFELYLFVMCALYIFSLVLYFKYLDYRYKEHRETSKECSNAGARWFLIAAFSVLFLVIGLSSNQPSYFDAYEDVLNRPTSIVKFSLNDYSKYRNKDVRTSQVVGIENGKLVVVFE